jgi:hypothetical protein
MSKTRPTRVSLLSDLDDADFETEATDALFPSEDEQRQLALDLLLDAWEEALQAGASADIVASAALYAAFSDMVDVLGEDNVADMAENLADRIRHGEFTLQRTHH